MKSNRRVKRQRSLNHQLLWLGGLPAAIMFLVLLVFFTTLRLDDARNDLYQSSQSLADNLAPAVEYAVVSGNTRNLERLLEDALQRSHAEYIRIANTAGRELGLAKRPGLAWNGANDTFQLFTADILQQPLHMPSGEGFGWFEPDFSAVPSAYRLGEVQVAVSERLLQAKRREIVWTSTIVGLSLLLVSLLVIRQLADRILRPISVISGNISQLINDRSELRALEGGAPEEIRALGEHLEKLAVHLADVRKQREANLSAADDARKRAQEASVAKSEFLAVMSHELRTPLNGISAMLDLLQEESLTSRQKDYLQTARQSASDLITVISDILDVSRLDRGKLKLDTQQFRLRDVIENCVSSFRHESENAGLTLRLDLDPAWNPKDTVEGDGARLRQVMASLIDNAIKFTHEGQITVKASTRELDEHTLSLAIEVSDSGRGMPANQVGALFQPFAQADMSNTRQFGGAGVGLSLVQNLVELMGGHVHVESEAGMGSTFKFEIPFRLVTSPQLAKPELTEEDAAGLYALVVEDNPVNQQVARTLLSRMGFNVDTAEDGQRAVGLVTARNGMYDLILMDCQMPVMDGYEATRCIRDWEALSQREPVVIIALTADATLEAEAACEKAGMNDYLSKPVSKERLKSTVSRWLQKQT